jgi:hypothetical protein
MRDVIDRSRGRVKKALRKADERSDPPVDEILINRPRFK